MDSRLAVNFCGSNPVGTVISFFGDTAPDGYLSCDGSVYDKELYPFLADHLLSLTSASQYVVDGDETKFKVSDLRGEFLRGSGTNSHANSGSGDNVGVHQNGTVHINLYANNNGNLNTYFQGESGKNTVENPDFIGPTATSRTYYNKGGTATSYMNMIWGTSRPTNTSVLYCIKY